MTTSLQKQLLHKIQKEGTVTYGALIQLTLEEGYKPETCARRLREHAEDGLIHPIFAKSKRNTKYISAYTCTKIVEEPKKEEYKVININGVPTAVLV